MSAGQIANLNEPVSTQATGIILVWQRRTGPAMFEDNNWNYSHIPKWSVTGEAGSGSGGTNCVVMDGSDLIRKYVYVRDTQIEGFASNGTGGNEDLTMRYILSY